MKNKKVTLSRRSFRFATWSLSCARIGDNFSVKAGTKILKIWKQIRLILGGKLTPRFSNTQKPLLRQLQNIKKSQGVKGLVLYLKTSSVILQQSISGHRLHDVSALGPRISRTKGGGLPRVIPSRHRYIISRRLVGYTVWVKFYLTVFHTYRVLNFPGTINLGSITDSGKYFDMSKYERYIERFLNRFVPQSMREDPVSWFDDWFKFFSIVKSSPQTSLIDSTSFSAKRMKGGVWSTHPVALYHSILSIRNSELWPIVAEFTHNWASILRTVMIRVGNDHPLTGKKIQLPIGKLGFKEEAAGKVRVFAMVDGITQWILYPLHRFLFACLRRLPTDGTFDQLRPIKRLLRLKGSTPLYSLDLSSATDRLPAALQARILDMLVPEIPMFGQKWRALLVNRSYRVKSEAYSLNTSVKYSVGQPMGALSSWAMLAVVHHFIVQVAAWEAGFPIWKLFTAYAVLGDDIVIADKKVALSYLRLLDEMGVKCGLAKSILSPTGIGLEFAKRTFVDGVDVSPIPLLELEAALSSLTSWASFAHKYGLSFDRQARVLGFGRARLRSFPRLNHSLQAVRLSGVLKGSFNTSVLKWCPSAASRDFDQLAPYFMEATVRPLISDLAKLQSIHEALSGSVTMPDLIGWTGVFSGMDLEERRIVCAIHRHVMWSDLDKVSRLIDRLTDLRDMTGNVKTFDEAIQLYLQFLEVKTLDVADVLMLNSKVPRKPGGLLPMQIKLYRLWARASLKVLAKYREGEPKS